MTQIGITSWELREAARILEIPRYQITGFDITSIFRKLDTPFLGLIGRMGSHKSLL